MPDHDQLSAELLKALLSNPHETATQSVQQLAAKAVSAASELVSQLTEPADDE